MVTQRRLIDDHETPFSLQLEITKLFGNKRLIMNITFNQLDLRNDIKFLDLYQEFHNNKEKNLESSLSIMHIKRKSSREQCSPPRLTASEH